MANLSTAFGTIELSSKNRELVETLYNSLTSICGEYATNLQDDFEDSKVEKYEDRYLFTVTFDATGRWTYMNNISNYPYWINLNEADKRKLEQNEWKIAYDFADEEAGNGVLYQALIEVSHEENTDIQEANIIEDITDYDYSWVNIVKLGFYDSIAEYVDNYYYLDGDAEAEWFMDDFEENVEDIAEYLGCGIEDMDSILEKSGLSEMYENAKAMLEI